MVHDPAVFHMQHGDMIDRARQMAELLNSAVSLAKADAYPAAFAVLRVCLEHQLLDDLVFRGRRSVQVFQNVSPELWAKWQAEREAGAAWAEDVVEWSRSGRGVVRVVRAGLYAEPGGHGERFAISIYYFLLQQYNPLAPPPSQATTPTQSGATDPDVMIRWAKTNRGLYEMYLRWSSIKENLQHNGFECPESIERIDVHYRFLSSYVHPISQRMPSTYGRNRDWPSYDHFASELCLLYVITFAVRELRSFRDMCAMDPPVGLVDPQEYDEAIIRLDRSASHLWFPGQPHHAYDLYASDNRADFDAFERYGEPMLGPHPLRYYTDPIQRLARLHDSSGEMTTGRVYQSPWQRSDARWR